MVICVGGLNSCLINVQQLNSIFSHCVSLNWKSWKVPAKCFVAPVNTTKSKFLWFFKMSIKLDESYLYTLKLIGLPVLIRLQFISQWINQGRRSCSSLSWVIIYAGVIVVTGDIYLPGDQSEAFNCRSGNIHFRRHEKGPMTFMYIKSWVNSMTEYVPCLQFSLVCVPPPPLLIAPRWHNVNRVLHTFDKCTDWIELHQTCYKCQIKSLSSYL